VHDRHRVTVQRRQSARHPQRHVNLLLRREHAPLLVQHGEQTRVEQLRHDRIGVERHAHEQNNIGWKEKQGKGRQAR